MGNFRNGSPAQKIALAHKSYNRALERVDIGQSVVSHLKARSVQFNRVAKVDLFGMDDAGVASRMPKKGDHPLVQVLKKLCNDYARLSDQDEPVDGEDGEPGKTKYGARLERLLDRIITIADKVATQADSHFHKEIKIWMEVASKHRRQEVSLEEAAKQLAKDAKVSYEVALNLLKEKDVDAEVIDG